MLLAVLAGEIAVFSVVGRNFLSVENALEIVRVSVEIGLLALALTPVIISGGIDLSVGSLMGLCAVVFGKLWLDPQLHSALGFEPGIAGAVVAALVVGAAAGLLNGLLITRLRIPPLIVTLGSMSLFRGLAEGITDGVENYTIPVGNSFLLLGNGYLFGRIPAQVPIFLAALAGFWLLMHRTIVGRAIVAIGFSPEGARYAGIPVARRVRYVYLLCGLTVACRRSSTSRILAKRKPTRARAMNCSQSRPSFSAAPRSLAAAARCMARLLGLLAIAVLKNGLQLADLPAELAGIMTGVLLLVTIIGNQARRSRSPFASRFGSAAAVPTADTRNGP